MSRNRQQICAENVAEVTKKLGGTLVFEDLIRPSLFESTQMPVHRPAL